MSVNDTTKLDYINNYFHQYLDIDLNRNILTSNFVNLVIPVEKLFELSQKTFESSPQSKKYSHNVIIDDDLNINDVLSKYENTKIGKEIECVCERVIDGDTFIAKVPIIRKTKDDEELHIESRKIRLVGVDTPEIDYDNPSQSAEGAEESKKMLEKICYSERYYQEYVVEEKTNIEPNDKKIYLNVDNKRQFDKYNRVLAVLIVDNKNINEVLLKEGMARVMYIPPTEFYPFNWDYTVEEKKSLSSDYVNDGESYNESPNQETESEQNNSVKKTSYDDLLKLSRYLNSDLTNIVFTPQDDTTKLYRYEVYKNVLYIRLDPYSEKIRMHILPKGYDCSNQLLFFKDNMVDKRRIYQTESNPYKIYKDIEEINAYFQENGEDRNRTSSQSAQTPYNETGVETTFCEFDYDISEEANSYKNIQICSGYSYNNTSPYYTIHYTGVKDEERNRAPEDRCSLIDGNVDEVKDKTNIISRMIYDDNNSEDDWTDDTISFPPYNDIPILCKFGSTKQYHTSDENLYAVHHKTIKYINHDMYTEEDIDYTDSANDDKYCYAEWKDYYQPVADSMGWDIVSAENDRVVIEANKNIPEGQIDERDFDPRLDANNAIYFDLLTGTTNQILLEIYDANSYITKSPYWVGTIPQITINGIIYTGFKIYRIDSNNYYLEQI